MKLVRRQVVTLAAFGIASLVTPARAQSYPTRPVRVIVPFAPGGPTDVFGRLMAQKLSDQLGAQFYVENVGGAGGNIGMGQGARAAPDGYTLIVVPPNIVVNPELFEKSSIWSNRAPANTALLLRARARRDIWSARTFVCHSASTSCMCRSTAPDWRSARPSPAIR